MASNNPNDSLYQEGEITVGMKAEQQELSGEQNLTLGPEVKPEMMSQFATMEPVKDGGQQTVSFQMANSNNLVNTSVNNGNVPMFQTATFDDVGQSNSGQTFLLTSSGNVLQTSSTLQGQDELLGVYLPTSSSVGYTTSQPTQYVTSNAIMQSVNQTPRIILQSGSSTIPPSIAGQNHYLVPIANHSGTSQLTGNSVSINNKGHIVIKSGTVKGKVDGPDAPPGYGNDAFRVVLRDGTTKITKPADAPRQHVQLSLPDQTGAELRIPMYEAPPQPVMPGPKKTEKLYECSNCNSQFMRPFNLRMHKRGCKKQETKSEKLPLFMCSFCKSMSKTKPQIHQHFSNCHLNPYRAKTAPDKVPTELDTVLEASIQYKCADCERTFNKERQFTSHIRRCTKVSFHDLSGARAETGGEDAPDDSFDASEDPFADPPSHSGGRRSGAFGAGRRGRPPRRSGSVAKPAVKSNVLFDGPPVVGTSEALLVADNENIVRSTTGLAHTVQLTLETAMMEEKPMPNALITDNTGVKGKSRAPQAWSLVCSLCKKMFLNKSSLASHVMQLHGNDLVACRNILHGFSTVAKDLYKCPLCSLHYQSEKEFLEHLVLKHTSKLQDCYAHLQLQKGSFVCSLCSIVLTTKSLLVEHISLEHLEDLQACAQKVQKAAAAKPSSLPPLDHEDSWDGPASSAQNNKPALEKLPQNETNSLECCYCGETSATHQQLLKHYVDIHEVETDVDGSLLDMGIDVDIKVKDTSSLLHMADSKITDIEREKTILMKKQPRQSFQCHQCNHVFPRQVSLVAHQRQGCGTQSGPSDTQKPPPARDFFCPESQCSHISFQQVKTLFKHLLDVHNVTVKKERKIFKTFDSFEKWLAEESSTNNVTFVTENSRIDKGQNKFLQMVCERFHSARVNKAKEKEADLSKPTKKRLYVRPRPSGDCHARIHLRINYNPATKNYDGETHMIYYPSHTHEEVQEGSSPTAKRKNGVVPTEELAAGTEIPSSVLQMIKTDANMPVFTQTSLPSQNGAIYEATTSQSSEAYPVAGSSSESVIPQNAMIVQQNGTGEASKPQNFIVEDGMVVDPSSFGEEYVLPADEKEWMKLFEVLQARLDNGDMNDLETKEAHELMLYQGVITMIAIQEQVGVFQKLCSLTNTAVDGV